MNKIKDYNTFISESFSEDTYYDLKDILLELNDLGYRTDVRNMDNLEFNRTVGFFSGMPQSLRAFIKDVYNYYDVDEVVTITISKSPTATRTGTQHNAPFFDNQEQYDAFNDTIDRLKEYMTGLGYMRRTYGVIENYVKEYYFKGNRISKVDNKKDI